jgi:hypothetical protein
LRFAPFHTLSPAGLVSFAFREYPLSLSGIPMIGNRREHHGIRRQR